MIRDHVPVPPQGLPILVIDHTSVCVPTAHVWPVDFAYGDACQCGQYSLLKDERGELQMEPREP